MATNTTTINADSKILRGGYFSRGTDLAAFTAALEDMDKRTEIRTLSTLDIHLLSLLDAPPEDEDGVFTFEDLAPGAEMLDTFECYFSTPIIGGESDLVKELRETKLMLQLNGESAPFFTAGSLITTLANRTQLGGRALRLPCLERDALLSKLFMVLEGEVKAVIRQDDGIGKVMALHSEQYARVPQVILSDIVKLLGNELGEPLVKRWQVDHHVSYIQIDFPDKAKDLLKLYGLSEIMIPGVRLMTSDTADSTVRAHGTWRIGRGAITDSKVFTYHRGSPTAEGILEQVRQAIFARYTILPEALAKLVMVEVPDPADALDFALEKVNFYTHIGKRRGTVLRDKLVESMNLELAWSAYDIAMMVMKLPGTIEGVSKKQIEELGADVTKAAFLDYRESDMSRVNIVS